MTRCRRVVLIATLALAACDGGDGRDDAAPPLTTTTSVPEDVVAPGGSLELSVEGDGFFIVRRDMDLLYTPSGTFTLDVDGKLAAPGGLPLQVWMADGDGIVETNGPVVDLVVPSRAGTIRIDHLGSITRRLAGAPPQTVGQIAVATFSNPGGLERLSGSLHRPTAESGLASIGIPAVAGRGTVLVGS